MYADLHIHSWYSDGTMTVDEIVEQARARQVSLIAVTDHNQLAGSRECLQKTRGTG
ncbi:MAG: PHP domain-containing protein, partial [Holdemania filiformis]